MSLMFAPCRSATNPALHIADSPMTLGRSGVTGTTSRGAGSVTISVPVCGVRMRTHSAAVAISSAFITTRRLSSEARLVRQKSRPPCRTGGQNHIKQQTATAAGPLAVVGKLRAGRTAMPHPSSP